MGDSVRASQALWARAEQLGKVLAGSTQDSGAPSTATAVLARVTAVSGRTVTLDLSGVSIPGVPLNRDYTPVVGDLAKIDVLTSGDLIAAYAVG